MPGGWWSECVCRCFSHVVMYDIVVSSFTTEHLYDLVDGLVTDDNLLLMWWPWERHRVLILLFYLNFCLQGRKGENRPDMIDHWQIRVKKLDPPVHSIMLLTSPNMISINSVKTNFTWRETLDSIDVTYICSKWTALSVFHSLKSSLQKTRAKAVFYLFKHFPWQHITRQKQYFKNLEVGPRKLPGVTRGLNLM